MQFAAPIAAHGDQGDVGALVPIEAAPGRAQDLIDEPGAILDQAANVPPRPEAFVQHLACLANGLLVRSDGAGLECELRLELAAVKQLRINLGHANVLPSMRRRGVSG